MTRAIEGVATSITAFVGFARRGPIDQPVKVFGRDEFTQVFGGLWASSTMSYAVGQYFDNGGSQAIVVRTARPAGSDAAATSHVELLTEAGDETLWLCAASPGTWGDEVCVRVDRGTSRPAPSSGSWT